MSLNKKKKNAWKNARINAKHKMKCILDKLSLYRAKRKYKQV